MTGFSILCRAATGLVPKNAWASADTITWRTSWI
jgi:hypothetical protein